MNMLDALFDEYKLPVPVRSRHFLNHFVRRRWRCNDHVTIDTDIQVSKYGIDRRIRVSHCYHQPRHVIIKLKFLRRLELNFH